MLPLRNTLQMVTDCAANLNIVQFGNCEEDYKYSLPFVFLSSRLLICLACTEMRTSKRNPIKLIHREKKPKRHGSGNRWGFLTQRLKTAKRLSRVQYTSCVSGMRQYWFAGDFVRTWISLVYFILFYYFWLFTLIYVLSNNARADGQEDRRRGHLCVCVSEIM